MKTKRSITLTALLVVGLWACSWARDIYVAPTADLTKQQQEMFAALNSDKAQDRAQAAEKLGVQCCKHAVSVLVQMMKSDEVGSVRIVAANALWKIGDRNTIAAIREQSQCDKNKTVRTVLIAIADKFDKGESANLSGV